VCGRYPPRDKLAVVRAWCDLDSNESIRSAKSGKSVETRLTKVGVHTRPAAKDRA
jgi:hypothetical protein